MMGREVKNIPLTEKGISKISLLNSDFKAGVYTYSLLIGNRLVDAKKMIVER
jgi:hypothetical protein